ncbi:hypothetical protein WJX73_009973 [Symbiochloris irregularis]|uniref:GST N-terminal domain-containing protein n=1 Tax=Symbiochloris irregularis TaxID=706552 RepID=A0AAW1NN78_9CHLO
MQQLHQRLGQNTLTQGQSFTQTRQQLLRVLRSQNAPRTGTRQLAAQGASDTQQKYTLKTPGGGTYKVAAGEQFNVATAGAQALLRAGSGAFVSDKLATFKDRPAKPIQLFEFEGCPFCRKVREACSILDIDVEFFPCPKDGPTWRPQAIKETGKSQFPYMKDPNTGRNMLESDAIISYLFEQYGDGEVPIQFKLGPLTTITAGLAMLPRAGKGTQYRRSRLPKQPLEVWGYEASPYCKLAREVLVELELPHIYHSVARNSPRREAMTRKWNQFQVPYLEDPNTMTAMFESNIIIDYLNQQYALP